VRVDRHVWAGDREANKQSSATAALQAVLDALKKELPPALPQIARFRRGPGKCISNFYISVSRLSPS